MYLVGTFYNFCSFHASLAQSGLRRTPAMAAGLTDHRCSVREVLTFKTPPKVPEPSKPLTRFEKYAVKQLAASPRYPVVLPPSISTALLGYVSAAAKVEELLTP